MSDSDAKKFSITFFTINPFRYFHYLPQTQRVFTSMRPPHPFPGQIDLMCRSLAYRRIVPPAWIAGKGFELGGGEIKGDENCVPKLIVRRVLNPTERLSQLSVEFTPIGFPYIKPRKGRGELNS